MVWNGRIIGKANKSCLAVYKQMEQQFIAMEENSITNKFQKNFATFHINHFYSNNFLLQTCETAFVINYFRCRCGD